MIVDVDMVGGGVVVAVVRMEAVEVNGDAFFCLPRKQASALNH